MALTVEPQLPPLRLAPPSAATAAAGAAGSTPQRRNLMSRAFTFTSRRLGSSSPAGADDATPPARNRSFPSRVVRSASFGLTLTLTLALTLALTLILTLALTLTLTS